MPLSPSAIAQIPLPPGKLNLNAGTLSPTPLPVLRRTEELRLLQATNPSDFMWRQTPALIESARASLATYLNARPADLLLLPNITYAINLVVSSLTLPRGTEVLLTDHDYGAMVNTWQRWASVRDWNLRTVPIPLTTASSGGGVTTPNSPDDVFSAITSAITPATRILFLYHVSSPTGLVFPLADICRYARERDILTVIDGAHGPGMIPVDLTAIGADFYASNLHKWLLCPSAGGFLHVAPHRRNDLRPLITSWGWGYERSKAFEDSKNGGSRWQWDLEFHGTADRTPQMALPSALAFRKTLGTEEQILAHYHHLSRVVRDLIPLPCASPSHPDLHAALTIFEVPPCDPIAIRDRLYNEFHIECPITVLNSPTGPRHFLRVSTATFTTADHLAQLAAAVKTLFPR